MDKFCRIFRGISEPEWYISKVLPVKEEDGNPIIVKLSIVVKT